MKKILPVLVCAAMIVVSCGRDRQVDLSGEWQVSLDSLQTFSTMTLPGTTDGACLGESNTLEPAITGPQIQRLTRKHSFLGAAFYKREFSVPSHMAGKPLVLTLERVIWQSSVWVDGVKLAAEEESLVTPHRYVIEDGLDAGRHEIMIRIDNRKRYDISWRDLAHAYTNDTQVIWNGILGEISLRAATPLEVASVAVYPDAAHMSVRVVTTLVRHDDAIGEAVLKCRIDGRGVLRRSVEIATDTTEVEYTVALPEGAALWDEFSPELHRLEVICGDDSREETFGIRSFESVGDHLEVNGRRVFLRGTLDCCIFPLTGTPPLDEAGWEKEFQTCRAWGLNHIRFHSWCPPEAAFRVADRMGFYLQVELPAWSKTVGREDVNAFLAQEYERIIAEYGNHPSFCMLSCGNEFGSGYDFLNALLRHMKETDPRHIYTNSTYSMGAGHKGRPEPEDQFMVASRTVRGQIRGQDYIGSREPDFRSDYSATASAVDIPLISHEIGQYSVYPRISEIEKYTGTLDPLNFKGVKAELEKKGRLDRADAYTDASGRLAAILYKEEVERALRTPEISGFQMLGLQDFSGQSTALVGLVDAFWDNKGLVTEEWFRQACAPVTPLARFEKACWTSDERFRATVEVANYWSDDIDGELTWTLGTEGNVVASGSLPAHLPTGGNTVLGEIEADLGSISEAVKLELRLSLAGTGWSNGWNVWVYPCGNSIDCGEVVLARTIDEALEELSEGGTVLLSPSPGELTGERGRFTPVFWSPVFFPKEAGTMGILCDPADPALAMFPTDMHSDWQWWRIVRRSKALDLDPYPEVRAIVEAVDNFTANRRLAYVFEIECESGRMLFSAIDLLGEEASRNPETRQLLTSLLDYMNSEKFTPDGVMTVGQLRSYFRE